MLTSSRATELLDRFRSQRLLVVGDLMLDRYVHGTVERISPEAPVPVVHVSRERSVPGGASNVALNIQALAGQALLCGIVGDGEYGDLLLRKLAEAGVDTSGILQAVGKTTIVKTRVIADQQQVVRVDREDFDMDDLADSPAFTGKVIAALADAAGVVIEDYGKGVVQQSVVDAVLQQANARGIPSGFDPKDNHELEVRGVTVATPNRKEAFHATGVKDTTPHCAPMEDPNLLEVGRCLQAKWAPEFLMLTLGPQGMLLVEKDADPTHVPTRAREVYDVSGAGDTVIATCLMALAAGATHQEAAELANYAAGLVVAKLGTATCTPEELLAAVEAGAA